MLKCDILYIWQLWWLIAV